MEEVLDADPRGRREPPLRPLRPARHHHRRQAIAARIDEGWRFIAVGSELKMMLDGAGALAAAVHPEAAAGELAKY